MERGSDGSRTEDVACLPSIRVRCAGIRADNFSAAALNARGRGLGSETNHTRLFFTEKQYAASPFLVRVSFDSVAFVHRGTHVVERRFVFPGRVLHAILSAFAPSATTSSQSAFTSQGIHSTRRQRGAPLTPRIHPHLCVLVRSDCLNVYTAAGDVFEVALPFQANRLFAMKGGRGLLLQRSPAVQVARTPSKRPSGAAVAGTNRRASTSNRGDGDRYNYSSSSSLTARPRYFTLSHPLDEVKPVALVAATATAVSRSGEKKDIAFLSDSALEAVAVLGESSSPVLVTFHRWEQRFCVFRMKMATPQDCQAQDAPRVRVVDGPAWTKHRARIDLEELRVRIEPDWMATSLWKSPRLDRPTSMTTFLSPILSPPSAEAGSSSPSLSLSPITGAGGVSKTAFVATDVDGLPLLCMMDKDTSTLFLKPFLLHNTSEEAGAVDSEVSGLRTLQCRDAIPICAQSRDDLLEGIEGHIDIVVLRKDGTLVLHQADHPVCRLVLPDENGNVNNGTNSDNFPERARLASTVQLRSIETGAAFEIVFPEFYGVWSGKLWRCEHPLKTASSPLLQQTFEVLACVLASPRLDTLKAHVIYRAQQKAQHPAEDEELGEGGYEWQSFRECMITLLLPQSTELEEEGPSAMEEDIAMDEEGVSSSFDTLCQSEYHDLYQYENSMLFATMELPTARTPKRHVAQIPTEEERGKTHVILALQERVEAIFAALHLLCEDFKLAIVLSRSRLQLADLLLEMATLMGLEPFVTYYKQDNCVFRHGMTSMMASSGTQKCRKTREEGLLCFATYGRVPGIIEWLLNMMATGRREEDRLFPGLLDDVQQERYTPGFKLRQQEGPLLRTMALCRIYELLFSSPEPRVASLPVARSRDNERAANMAKLMVYLTQDPIGSVLSLNDLPVGLSFPIMQAIRQVKHSPPLFITEDVCAFIGREDLGAGMGAGSRVEPLDSTHSAYHHQRDTAEKAGGTHFNGEDGDHDGSDGLDEIITRSQRLFPTDQRMKEVARLLRSSRPLCLKLEKTPDMSDLDYAQQHQARLLLLCKRSMALSVARGMVTLGSVDVSVAQTQAWQLRVPALPLAGRKPPANAIVELDLSGYAKELTYWPQFHNGCATGLRLPAQDLSGVINRHWIKYHRPSVSDLSQRNSATSSTGSRQSPAAQSADAAKRNLDESYASHAGLLLGIGLRGHLKCLSMADVYNYLSLSNEFVTVAIMLGMASTAAHCRRKRKQQAASVSATTSDAQAFHGHSPPPATSSSEDAKDDMMPLEADGFLSSSLAFSPSSKMPLVGMGLELALERSVSKMLCLHVPSLLPPPFAGFSVPVSTQTAALLGLGILYQGTGYRLMTELLLTEIARSPSSAQFVGSTSNTGLPTASFGQLEGYSLAAGMALGLVVLGRGQTSTGDPGLADLKLEEKLHKYIVGGAQQYRDTNAAGSCLYRGRRWQTFGNGGGRLNAGVNGAAGSGASPNSTEASPGADREAKHTQDRGGLRGGGEHVNIGVTACSSALALAFMYMQTDNKAVAAQLEVPDTLILLDYVRPDILLVRTLAKNLIMWNDVSPTTQWIEQHEVPAQLQQAYKALHPFPHGSGQNGNQEAAPSGLPAHADVHSICESYANIITGACLSIGLRFAGTASAAARETLRKYVLHFRELRSKASSSSMILRGSSNVVAAATERATVERCLAVCAQSLALVDAGTGNVETLALLRSLTLRQRVDAAMTYGNHMALSMAIGLLFLGGGRATLSRSKEAVAALVISLYPMVPMNTADNKYHLQAFRHLYVLAVDNSRLLETVDVNAKANCAVQVRLELHPDGGRAAESIGKRHLVCQQLRTPCLLPELATIKRLVISDPEFYPVEILMSSASEASDPPSHDKMRTANALRLELLRSSNVVLLKRRKRQDSVESLVTFTDELQQLHNLHLGTRGGKDDEDNQLMRLFRSYFAASSSHEDDEEEDGDDDFDDLEVADWGSGWWASQLSPRALEQVREETQLLLPSHFNALHALFRLQQVPHLACTTEVTTLRLFCDYYRSHMTASMEGIGQKEDPSYEDLDRSLGVGILEKHTAATDFGTWLSNQTEEALRALWQRSSLAITSLASARVQLLVESPPSASSPPLSASRKAQQALDAFLMDALVRYFAGPSSPSLSTAGRQRSADKDWKAKFQRVLAACSQTQQRSASPTSSSRPQFQLAAFLEQDELTEAEKAFWLKLVSFFLFST